MESHVYIPIELAPEVIMITECITDETKIKQVELILDNKVLSCPFWGWGTSCSYRDRPCSTCRDQDSSGVIFELTSYYYLRLIQPKYMIPCKEHLAFYLDSINTCWKVME